jgi:hypothetical protein
MKNEQKEVSINDHLSCAAISAQIMEGNIAQMPHLKSLKDMTAQQKKMDASKPIYLVRYE